MSGFDHFIIFANFKLICKLQNLLLKYKYHTTKAKNRQDYSK